MNFRGALVNYRAKSCLRQQIRSNYSGLKKACCPDWRRIYLTGKTGESCPQRCPGVYAEIVVMLSANIPIVPPTPPRHPSPLLNTSNSWLLHKQHANRSRDVMPPHPRLLRSGGDSPLSCSSTFNFHPTWRCTSSTWSRGWLRTLPAHTHFSSGSTENNYPVLHVSRHQLATITVLVICLPVNFNRRTHIFL